MARAEPTQPASPATTADLALLVEIEEQLETKLALAREQAQRLVAAARAEAEARTRAENQALHEAREQFQSEVEAERGRRATELLADGSRQAARFDGVPEARIAELAGLVLARLVGEGNR